MAFFQFRNPPAIRNMQNPLSFAFLTILLTAFYFAAAVPNGRAEPRQAPNSRVSLDLSDSFQPSDRFTGFVDESSGASFIIVELPAQAYEELKIMPERKEELAKQGLTDTTTSTLSDRDGDYVYFTGKQSAGGVDVAKYVLIFRESDLTVMISANIPQAALDARTFAKEQIEAILASAKVEDTAAKAAELFRFKYLGPFQETFGLMGTTKAYNISGTRPAQGENMMIKEPLLLVSPSIDDRAIDTKPAAQRSFQALGGVKQKKVESEKEVTIAGLQGYQIIGETVDEATGTKIAINFILLAGDPRGYYAMIGTAPMADRDKIMAEIEKVFASFEPLKPEK